MSIALVVTRGFGNGTLIGTIPFVVTAGYDAGEKKTIWTNKEPTVTIWTDKET